MSIELHCARATRWCLMRLTHAALATCIAGFGAGCSEAPGTARFAVGALDAAVSYPSSAAYDARADMLLVGSYSDGSILRIPSARGARHTATFPLDGREQVLRVRLDAQHNRIWVLASDALTVYDADTLLLSRRIPIDALTQHSSEHCLPDVALDSVGNVFISSAMRASLMRVDAQSFEVTQHDVQVDADHFRDFGFSALAFAGKDDTLYAASATTGALWEIDLAQNQAQKIALSQPIYGACALHTEPAETLATTTRTDLVFYVAGGFRDRVMRVHVSAPGTLSRVTTVQSRLPLIVPTDFVQVERKLLIVSSRLSQHPEFDGRDVAAPPSKSARVQRPG